MRINVEYSTQHWIFPIITIGVLVILGVLVKRVVAHPFGVAALSVVLAGAVGNLIDRALMGYVTDMFQTLFMNFPIFNVADICIVCGGIAFCVYFLLFCKEEDKA